MFAELAPRWRERGYGVQTRRQLLQFITSPHDACLVAKNAIELNGIVRGLEEMAARVACLTLRPQKCTHTQVQRKDQSAEVVPDECISLRPMAEWQNFQRGIVCEPCGPQPIQWGTHRRSSAVCYAQRGLRST